MIEVTSTKVFDIRHPSATVYEAGNPSECSDFKHIIGQDVKIDNVVRRIYGVQYPHHNKPWAQGEQIGFMVVK